jgi:GNAT superfamily N-acetyltransferase
MDRTAILKAFEANVWDRAAYLARGRKDAEIIDNADLLIVDSGLPSAALNIIGKSALHPRFAADRIEAAVKRFRAKEFPFTWILGPLSGHGAMEPALTELGMSSGGEEWVMAMSLDSVNVPGIIPPALEIKRVSTAAGIEQFANVMAAATTPADPHLKTFYVDAREAAIAPASPERIYIGSVNGEPVAVLEAFSAHGIIGFYAMGAVPAVRGKGYAAALIINTLREAKKAGLRLAGLTTVEAGRALYERIGFKPVGRTASFR